MERREAYRERIFEICRGGPSSIQLTAGQHMHVRKLLKARERNENEEHSTYIETGVGFTQTSRLEKLIIHLALGRIHSKVLLQEWGVISPRLKKRSVKKQDPKAKTVSD